MQTKTEATGSGADWPQPVQGGALALLVARMRAQTGRAVPDVDPADGGIRARVLLLLERPGLAVGGCGVVSRDNARPTARNIGRFCEEAGLPRSWMLIWNAVPWLDTGARRNAAPRAEEIKAGLAWLPAMLDLLPVLEVVVLAGRVAGMAAGTVRSVRPEIVVMSMPHPSPTFVCTSPQIGERIRACLSAAGRQLRQSQAVRKTSAITGVSNVGSG